MDPWTLAAVVVLVLGGGWFLWSGRGVRHGSGAVRAVLEGLGPDYAVVSDIILSTPDGMIDLDYAVVSPYGVFLVNERLESGTVWVSPGRREWDVSGQEPLHNPLWRNRRVVNHLQEKTGNLNMVSLVVFVNARLKGQGDPHVLTLRQLAGAISSYRQVILSADQQASVRRALGSAGD